MALRAKRIARVAVAIGSLSLVFIYAAPLAVAFTTPGPTRVHSLDALSLPNLQFPRLATSLPAQSQHAVHAVPTHFFTTHHRTAANAAASASTAPRFGYIALRRNWIAPPPVTSSSYGPALSTPPASTATDPTANQTPVTSSVGSEPSGFDASASAADAATAATATDSAATDTPAPTTPAATGSDTGDGSGRHQPSPTGDAATAPAPHNDTVAPPNTTPSADGLTTDTSTTDSTATDTSSTDTSSTDTTATDTSSTDTASTDTATTDTAATDTPATDTPATDTSSTDTPSADTGSTGTTSTDTSSTDTPTTDTPTTDTPTTDTPSTDTGSATAGTPDTGSSGTSAAAGATPPAAGAPASQPAPVAVTGTDVSLSSDGTTLTVTVDGVSTTYALADVARIDVTATSLTVDTSAGAIAAAITFSGDSLTTDSGAASNDWTLNGDGTGTVTGGASISFSHVDQVAGGGSDTLHGPSTDTTWTLTGSGSGTVAGTSFGGFANLAGAAGNKDTFDVEQGGSVTGSIDGGGGGYDSLVIAGHRSSVISTPTDAHSGGLLIDGVSLRYTGFEPVGITGGGAITINGADKGFNTLSSNNEALDKDLLKVSPYTDGSITPTCGTAGNCIQVHNLDGPFGLLGDIAEFHYFVIAGATGVTIDGGLGADTVEFTGDYVAPGTSLTVNAEHIKVDPGVTVNVGTATGNDINFNASYLDDGLSVFGITTTIPILGVDGLVDIGVDKGLWQVDDDYDAGDVVVDPATGNQYRATGPVSSGGSPPSSDPTDWAPAGTTQLIGSTVNLIATAGTVFTTASGAQSLGGDLIVASVAGFSDTGTLVIDNGNPTPASCTYTGRDIANHKFTGLAGGGCTGSVADTKSVKQFITEAGSGTGITHAGLDLEYHATVDVHGATHITAAGNVKLQSTIDATASASAKAGPDLGAFSTGTFYKKGDVVTDTDNKRYAATSDVAPSSTHPKDDTNLLTGHWTEAKDHDSSAAATFVLALATSRLTGSSWITTTGDVAITTSIKTHVATTGDASAAGSGAGISVAVFVTDSEAYIDSNAATPVTAANLTIEAATDNAAPTDATASPKGEDTSANSTTSSNKPTQGANTTVDGLQTLPGSAKKLTVASTAGFVDAGTITVDGIGDCTYTSRTDTEFTGIAGCTGTVADKAHVTGKSKQQAGANGQADDKSKTADGNQNLNAALAVVVLISTTQAWIAPSDAASPHAIMTSGGTDMIRAKSTNAASAIADAGNVKFSPDAPTATPNTGSGSLPAGTYYYKVTATFASGESLPSTEKKVELTGGTGHIALSWGAIDGATGYKVYRGDASGNETLLKTVTGGGTTTYDDVNTGSAGDGTPDGTTKPRRAIRAPASGSASRSWSASSPRRPGSRRT